ncbi:Radial spoke protein 1 [Phytophthora cinnamomi]|nr:Radial spoke protein 1 [Phytophthora cinnamomi]
MASVECRMESEEFTALTLGSSWTVNGMDKEFEPMVMPKLTKPTADDTKVRGKTMNLTVPASLNAMDVLLWGYLSVVCRKVQGQCALQMATRTTGTSKMEIFTVKAAMCIETGECMRLHGHGERVYLPLEFDTLMTKDMLEKDTPGLTLAAGGPMGLYGVVQYVGEFEKNVRHGEGELLYTNGYRLHGRFVNGFVEGVACYGFGGHGENTRWRYGEFVRGERKRWLSAEEEAVILKHKKDQKAAEAHQQSLLRALVSR